MYSDKKDAAKPAETSKEQTSDTNTTNTEKVEPATSLSPVAKLKNAVKDYGATVIVFHVALSLTSLGICYQLVSSGIDMVAVLEYLGLGSTSSTISTNVTSGATK